MARQLGRTHPQLLDITDRIADGTPVEGMEALAPVLVDELQLLVDELPTDTTVLVCDPEKVRTRAHDLVRTSREFLEASWATAAVGGAAPIDLGSAATLRAVFDHVALLAPPATVDGDNGGNLVLVASDDPLAVEQLREQADDAGSVADPDRTAAFAGDAQVLTDDDAPVDQLLTPYRVARTSG